MKIVTAAIIRRGEGVLLTRRAPGDRHQGSWEFPGGKLESGETLQQCLERELFEELGVLSKAGSVVCSSDFTYDHGCIRLVAIETSIESDDFHLSAHDRFEWVDLKHLLNYELLPADIPVAKFLHEERVI